MKANRSGLLHRLLLGLISGLHFGIPCATWSRARRNDGKGPGPVRDAHEFLDGFDNMSAKDHAKVLEANRLLRLMVWLARVAIKMGLPVSIESPSTSRLWLTHEIQSLTKSSNGVMCQVDYCAFKMPWRKRTTFLLFNWGVDSTWLPKCVGKHGLCSFSGKAHLQLSGRAPGGAFRTAVAQPYPEELCDILAAHIKQQLWSRRTCS